MKLLVFASSIALGLCAGEWSVQNPTDQKWCDKLVALDQTYHLISLPGNGCPHILGVEQQVVSGTNTKFTLLLHQQQCELIVYEQEWTNIEQIAHDTCQLSVQHKRQDGGWQEQDPTDQQWYVKLHELQQNGLLRFTNGVQIAKVATQVVSGTNTKFSLIVHQLHCEMIVYEQVWTNTVQIMSDTCQLSAHHKRQLAGGWHERDPTDQQWVDKLHELEKKGLLQSTVGVHIVKVATQVVSGINTKYTCLVNGHECELIVNEQASTNTVRIISDTCRISVQRKRQLLGAMHPVTDMNGEGVQGCIALTLDKINMMSYCENRVVESNIISATEKVVAGINYNIKLETKASTCMNSKENMGLTSSNCPIKTDSVMQSSSTWSTTCTYQAWSTPKVQVLSVNMVQ